MTYLVVDPIASCTNTTRFEVDHIFLQDFQEWISMSSDDEWDKYLSSYLDSYNISSQEDKFDFLKKLLKSFEIEYERLLSEKTSQDVSIGVMYEKIVPHKQEFIKVDASYLESKESVLHSFYFYEDIVAEGFPTESKSPLIQKDDLRDKFVDHEIVDAFFKYFRCSKHF